MNTRRETPCDAVAAVLLPRLFYGRHEIRRTVFNIMEYARTADRFPVGITHPLGSVSAPTIIIIIITYYYAYTPLYARVRIILCLFIQDDRPAFRVILARASRSRIRYNKQIYDIIERYLVALGGKLLCTESRLIIATVYYLVRGNVP